MDRESNTYINGFDLQVDRSHVQSEDESYDGFNSIPVQSAGAVLNAHSPYTCQQYSWEANLYKPQVSYETEERLEGRTVGHFDIQ